ncbi:MAG: hypothetical protein R3E98_04590 [Gemmatimonadota bacterium]
MCRLTAYVGAPAPVAPLVYGGNHPLLRQSWAPQELLSGSVNADGWGVVWMEQGRLLRLSAGTPLWQAHDLEPVLQTRAAPAALAALRNITDGVPLGPDGTPPLLRAGHAFVLNGFLGGYRQRLRRLLAPLSDETLSLLQGTTDTELLFLNVLERVRRGASPPDALADVVDTSIAATAADGEEAQIVCAWLTPTGVLHGARASSTDACNSLYALEGGTLAPEGVLIASERLDTDPGWAPVPSGSVFTLDAQGLRARPL